MEKVDLSRREIVTKDLISNALTEISRKYGSGQGDGENPKRYHNVVHTQDVLTAAQQIAGSALSVGKIEKSDVSLIELAAGFHDIEQDLGTVHNEERSAQLAEEAMKKSGVFDPDEIDKVKKMILATVTYFENGVMKQSAKGEYLDQVVADADLSSLGRETGFYWLRAIALLREIKNTNSPSIQDEITFSEGELRLLENHHFYTREAATLFPSEQENIKFTKQHIDSLGAKPS